jgi:predicted small metal-binding protein
MTTNRKVLDCRWFPAYIPCEFATSGNKEEVLSRAVAHAIEFHGYRDTPSLREQLRSMMRDEHIDKAA